MVSLAYPIDRLDKALLKWFVMINDQFELDNKAFNSYGQGPAKPLKSHWTQWWVSKKAFNGDSQGVAKPSKSIDVNGLGKEKHYHPIKMTIAHLSHKAKAKTAFFAPKTWKY